MGKTFSNLPEPAVTTYTRKRRGNEPVSQVYLKVSRNNDTL